MTSSTTVTSSSIDGVQSKSTTLDLIIQGGKQKINVKTVTTDAWTTYFNVTHDSMFRWQGKIKLGSGAVKVLSEPNAGGTSVVSEVLSAEYMHRRFGASNFVPEMKIQYVFSNWKKIDYITTIQEERVGVSVTRAMGYPYANSFRLEDATRLCYKKLYGLIVARSGISKQFSYSRSILHCLCQSQSIANMMRNAFLELLASDIDLQDDLVNHVTIILTVCYGLVDIFVEDFHCFE